MRYSNLIGDEVVWGSPSLESFQVISAIEEEGDLVKVSFDSGAFTRIPKKDFDIFLKNEEVEFVRKFPDGNAIESLLTVGKQQELWGEESSAYWGGVEDVK